MHRVSATSLDELMFIAIFPFAKNPLAEKENLS
jgi:hypothetical protein